MRVCRIKATGILIESQSGGSTQKHLDTLLKNAVNSGYKKEEIEAVFITDAEHKSIIDALPKPVMKESLEDRIIKLETRITNLEKESK